MKFEFETYNKLPEDLKEIRDKVFSHSLLIKECEILDKLGEYTALFINGRFIGAMNTIYNQKPIELWSNNKIIIEKPYNFFCRGFINPEIKSGFGGYILSILLSYKIANNDLPGIYYTTCREKFKSVRTQLLLNGYNKKEVFLSHHHAKPTELTIFKFQESKEFANERKTELISYLQQAM